MRILSLAGRRLAASIPTLILILIGVFLLLQLAPGDTVDALMAQMGGGDAATARELRHFYGLDLSVPAQLANYLWHLVRLDLGFSSIYGKPVATVIGRLTSRAASWMRCTASPSETPGARLKEMVTDGNCDW